MKDFEFGGATAIVTGAASGIGEALVAGLGRRGSHLVLVDRDAAGLERVAAALRQEHPELRLDTVVVDLSDRGATERTATQLVREHPSTTLLINNAGVAMGGNFEQLTLEEFSWLLEINFHAVVTLTHHLLPVLQAKPGSHLVNVSSVFGLIAPAGQSAYSASKFAVRGFTEALRHELGGRVGVTCVHPGGVATKIAASARIGSGVDEAQWDSGRDRIGRLLTIPPATAAEAILRGVEHRRPRVLIGATARIPDLVARLAPGSYGALLKGVSGRPKR